MCQKYQCDFYGSCGGKHFAFDWISYLSVDWFYSQWEMLFTQSSQTAALLKGLNDREFTASFDLYRPSVCSHSKTSPIPNLPLNCHSKPPTASCRFHVFLAIVLGFYVHAIISRNSSHGRPLLDRMHSECLCVGFFCGVLFFCAVTLCLPIRVSSKGAASYVRCVFYCFLQSRSRHVSGFSSACWCDALAEYCYKDTPTLTYTHKYPHA